MVRLPEIDCPVCWVGRGTPPYSCLGCKTTIPRGVEPTRTWGQEPWERLLEGRRDRVMHRFWKGRFFHGH